MEKLEKGKNYKIGKYDNVIIDTQYDGKYYMCHNNNTYEDIFCQFGIQKSEIYDLLGYQHFGIFPPCNSLEDLQKVYEYIMSKDPNNKKTINVEDLKYPDQIHITSKEQYDKIKKYYNKLDLYNVEYKYYLADYSGKNEIPFTGTPASISKTDSYNLYEFEDIIFPEEKQEDKFVDKTSLKKSFVFKKGIWYKYHGGQYYMHCYKDAIDTLFYDKFIEVSTGHIGTDNSSYSNQYITDEEVPLSEIEKYIPNKEKEVISSGAIHRDNLIKDEFYVGNWSPDGKVIFRFSGDLKECNHLIQIDGKYDYDSCCTASDIIFRQATKEEKELLISKIPKETMKEQVNFIHGEYYVDRVNSGGSRIFKYDKPDHQLYYINTAVKCFFIDNYDSSLEKDSVPATQKEIDWLNKCIKANRFVSEDYFVELTSLPEKWCISRNLTSEQNKIITKWINTKFNYAYSSHLINDYYYHDGYHGSKSDYTSKNLVEITYEQFKKWVMKKEEPDILPHEIPNTAFISSLKETYYVGQPLSELNIPDIGFNVYNEQNKALGSKYNLTSDKLYKDLKITELKPGYFAIGNWNYKWFKISEIEGNSPLEQVKEHYNETINSSTNVEYFTKEALPLYNVKKRLVLN